MDLHAFGNQVSLDLRACAFWAKNPPDMTSSRQQAKYDILFGLCTPVSFRKTECRVSKWHKCVLDFHVDWSMRSAHFRTVVPRDNVRDVISYSPNRARRCRSEYREQTSTTASGSRTVRLLLRLVRKGWRGVCDKRCRDIYTRWIKWHKRHLRSIAFSPAKNTSLVFFLIINNTHTEVQIAQS